MESIQIGNRIIGPRHPVFIIAELSANHLQDYSVAVRTIRAMKKAGADAVKVQTYTPDTITIDGPQECFRIKGTLWSGRTLYGLYKKAYMPWAWQPKLKKIAEEIGLIFFSSPFDHTAVDFLSAMHVPAYKIASFEITDIPLIEHAARKKKPMLISTGIAQKNDIQAALVACARQNNHQVALLKCVSSYPTPLEAVNLRMIPHMAKTFHTVIGLSDHTLGVTVPIAAVALGARIIEKHFILDRKLGGPDSAFSLEPEEFGTMVKAVRDVEKALGRASYALTAEMKKGRTFARSLFAVADIKAGEKISEDNIRSVRPGCGLHPKYLAQLIGKAAKRDIARGEPLSWDLIR